MRIREGLGALPSLSACARSLARAGLCAALASVSPAAEAERLHRYTVRIDEALTVIGVRACFSGAAPRHLVAESLDASATMTAARVESGGRKLEPNGAELRLGALPEDACVLYQAEVGQMRRRHERGGAPTRYVGRDLITDLGIWLWRPGTLEPDEDIEVRFELPAGISVSAPWQPARATDGETVYRVGHTPYDWPAAIAFGHFTEQPIEVSGARLRVAVLDGAPAVRMDDVRTWLTRAASAVATLYARFPVPQIQVLVVPGARGNEPVPWAYVLRGGGYAAHFFINQRRPLSEFLDDWTAVHELSHLLLPYIQSEDAWLSEGLASYYQNVLRARAGVISEGDAWQLLHRGFRRGMQSQPGVTLAHATERMYRGDGFLRVYWEGAAIMLLADQRLRSRTDGAQSLDAALARFQACCLSPDRAWRARELFAKLDELSGSEVFGELYDEHVASERFPDLGETYRLLGLRVDPSSDMVELIDSAPQARYRRAIMARRTP